jgi:hypothetical protein
MYMFLLFCCVQAAGEAAHAKTLADADDSTKWLKKDDLVRALFVGMYPPMFVCTFLS